MRKEKRIIVDAAAHAAAMRVCDAYGVCITDIGSILLAGFAARPRRMILKVAKQRKENRQPIGRRKK